MRLGVGGYRFDLVYGEQERKPAVGFRMLTSALEAANAVHEAVSCLDILTIP